MLRAEGGFKGLSLFKVLGLGLAAKKLVALSAAFMFCIFAHFGFAPKPRGHRVQNLRPPLHRNGRCRLKVLHRGHLWFGADSGGGAVVIGDELLAVVEVIWWAIWGGVCIKIRNSELNHLQSTKYLRNTQSNSMLGSWRHGQSPTTFKDVFE